MRHHFVPVFYLKHFTLHDGFFYIYDVKRKAFKKHGKKFAPNSHFYEPNLNTVYNEQNASYFLETSLTKDDNEISRILDKIAIDKSHELTPHEWTYLQYFTNILYWRNPSQTPYLEKLIADAKNLSAFGMSLRNKATGERLSNEKERELILNNPQFIKFLRVKMPGTTYPEVFKLKAQDYATIITFPSGFPGLVSDNPVIYLNEECESLHTAPMIFLLTPTKVLFRHIKPTIIIPSWVRVVIDTILYGQAKNYISCTEQRYPMLLAETYHKYGSTQPLKRILSDLLK
ncbi:MAG: hypothetical protein BGO55_01405 [Sphingobacteriales bacterium 50-39]|nr:DUF4238 domain-containing protein [Sphingobacteriales bacterium]OJW53762.1 MAG: hypothetical protein BGO55_01405 [Sphingobacteriales bacterium 50-39]